MEIVSLCHRPTSTMTGMIDGVALVGSVMKQMDSSYIVVSSCLGLVTRIPWGLFRDAIKEFDAKKELFSDASANAVVESRKLLREGYNKHCIAKNNVGRFCKLNVPFLDQCLSLFESDHDSIVAEAQKKLLLKAFNEGSQCMLNAMQSLEESKKSMETFYDELDKLWRQFGKDFKALSQKYANRKRRTRGAVYVTGAIVCTAILLGPFGWAAAAAFTGVTFAGAVGLAEGILVPDIDKAFEDAKTAFNKLKSDVLSMIEESKSAISVLRNEIKKINGISTQIVETEGFADTWALLPLDRFDDFKRSTQKLIDMCSQYIKDVHI